MKILNLSLDIRNKVTSRFRKDNDEKYIYDDRLKNII
jgi:hypothetical protein